MEFTFRYQKPERWEGIEKFPYQCWLFDYFHVDCHPYKYEEIYFLTILGFSFTLTREL